MSLSDSASAPGISHLDALVRSVRGSDRALELVRSLTDEVGPRYPCTPGDVAAVAWAKERMRDAGLENVRSEVAPAELWERGSESCELILPRRQPVVLTALGGSVGTGSAPLEGEVVEFGSLEDLEAAPAEKVRGRVVYLHHVMPRRRDGTGYNAGSIVRMRGPSAAAKKGALACLVRSVGTDSMRAAHTGALFYEPGVATIPAAALSIPDADLLHRHLASGKAAHTRLALGCRPLPVGESANVIAELPGTDLADEIVLVGAHLDSWDLGTGALDDGAGCAIAIAAAAAIAALPTRPRRTIRVALFANEELGTGGGIAYAKTHADEASRHVVAMEADQGDGAPWALRVPAADRDSTLTAALLTALGPLGIELDAGPSRGGVDIGPLRQLGIPFLDLRQDATRYFDFHHTVNDVFENVSREDIAAATTAFAVALQVTANADGRFGGEATKAA
ncbi:MAG TPA: M20/M25/M40 family metallo-hydrolase [Polyangiaceae bacterium]|nr:M20/M25/M40 family metallo-hydrolase [Polyangiaceae bacterium]